MTIGLYISAAVPIHLPGDSNDVYYPWPMNGCQMKIRTIILVFMVVMFNAAPAEAMQEAILPADALVSKHHSALKQYQRLKATRKNASAKKLLRSKQVFICPRDTKVEVVVFKEKLARIKLSRLDNNARPIAIHFWTLAEQLRMLPQ
jgi:hypothetical protein